MIYVILKPDKTPHLQPFADMASAQAEIAALEPDILKQAHYQIHPIADQRDAERLKLKMLVHWKLEKFEGDRQPGQIPFETLEGTFDGTH